jgi:hypothetical protein
MRAGEEGGDVGEDWMRAGEEGGDVGEDWMKACFI